VIGATSKNSRTINDFLKVGTQEGRGFMQPSSVWI
jgi:hypothetical protein